MFVQVVAAVLITSLTVGFASPSQGRQFKGTVFDVVPHPPEDELQKLRDVVPANTGIACGFHLLHFQPPGEAGVLVDFAKSEGVDMIVVGTHGRSGISHLLGGSVAESIIRQAPCPVIAVKQQH